MWSAAQTLESVSDTEMKSALNECWVMMNNPKKNKQADTYHRRKGHRSELLSRKTEWGKGALIEAVFICKQNMNWQDNSIIAEIKADKIEWMTFSKGKIEWDWRMKLDRDRNEDKS